MKGALINNAYSGLSDATLASYYRDQYIAVATEAAGLRARLNTVTSTLTRLNNLCRSIPQPPKAAHNSTQEALTMDKKLFRRVCANTTHHSDRYDYWLMKVRTFARGAGLTPAQTERLAERRGL